MGISQYKTQVSLKKYFREIINKIGVCDSITEIMRFYVCYVENAMVHNLKKITDNSRIQYQVI